MTSEQLTEPIRLPDGHDRPPRRRAAGSADDPPRAASRWWLALAWLVLFALLASHDIGSQTFDTKLGVDIDPLGFYQRLTELWNPRQWFGGLQDQYIGYAFPMGVFYLLGHLAAVPTWLIERSWMALLAAAGFWGIVRLAEALRIGGPRTRLLAGAAFALWPTYTILIGSTSAAVLPPLLAPWAVLPLVVAARGGSTRLAAARSGLVVLAMGGVNAAVTIAALVLPGLYLLTRPAGRRRWSLIAWWVPAVMLATAWWLVPLFFQQAFGANFLPYVEQASNTTQTMSASAFLRGSGNWVAYLNFGSPWLTAGWAVVSGWLPIAAVTLVSAAGLAGLARSDLPEGRWLRLAAGLAALIALAGYAGPVGGPFHGTVQALLDGPLAPFRNIYKFEPVLAAAIALGMAHVLTRLAESGPVTRVRPAVRPVLRWGSVALSLAMLVGLAAPYGTGQVLQPGAFSNVPDYWRQAADYLASHSPTEPAMVVPADSHGLYTWGTTVDDPLEPLATSPWVQRDLVPFSGTGAASMLDAAERAIESGGTVPGLAAYLARAGVRLVVVRNDLDPTQLGYVSPVTVHQTLANSGFHQVAAFGPQVTGGLIYPGTPLPAQALMRRYPAVEMYEPNTAPPVPFGPVTTQATVNTMRVAGDPGSLLQLANQGALTDQPVLLAGDTSGVDTDPAAAAVTDGYRRHDTQFGLINRNTSYTYTPTGTNPPDDPHGGGGSPPRQLLPVGTQGNQTTARLTGAADVTAASSGSWLWELPEYDPVNAFDGDPATSWVEGSPDTAVGQWLRIDFQHELALPATAGIRLLADTTLRPTITKITTTTAAGSATTELTGTGDRQPLRLPTGATNWLRITIDATTKAPPGGLGAGISDVDLPGVRVTRYLATPPAPATGPITFSFHRDSTPPLLVATGQPENQLARTFTTTTPTDLRMSASAVAVPGAALNGLLDSYRTGSTSLQVSANSTWGSLPQFRAANLVDGDYRTGWVAGGPNAVVHLSWSGRRSISKIFLLNTVGLASAPTSVRLSSPDGTRDAKIDANGAADFPALDTDRLDISFPSLTGETIFDPVQGTAEPLPVGLTELSVPELEDLRVPPPDPSTTLNLSCGKGPVLTVDGMTYQTSVTGTVGGLMQGRPLAVALCTPGGALHLEPGTHTLFSPGTTGPVAIGDLSLSEAPPVTAAAVVPRPVSVVDWGTEQRQVRIGSGGSAYLEVHQAYNRGWTATLDGTTLTPIRLDGWQQGFLVPAGTGGLITLSFPPGTAYRDVLIGAGIGVVVLVVLAVLPARRRRALAPAPRSASSAVPNQRWWLAALLVVTLLFVVIGGWAAVVVPLLAALGFVRPAALPWVAGAGALGAGICVLAGLGAPVAAVGHGAFSALAQVFALVSLAAVFVPVAAREPAR